MNAGTGITRLTLPALLDPRGYARALRECVTLLAAQRRLAFEMARRELQQRHLTQALGPIWMLGQPMVVAVLYVFLFQFVFKTRMSDELAVHGDYTVYMLAGLVPWLAFSNALGVGCSSITTNALLVKQFVFRLEVLPTKDALLAMLIWGCGMAVLLTYMAAVRRSLPATVLLLPLAAALQLTLMIGILYGLSALSVFVRDLREIVTVITTVMPFILPIVYLPEWVPAALRPILWVNPLSYMVWVYQDVLFFGKIEHPVAWIVFATLAILSLAAGYRVFRRLRPYFANFL
jgi:lipopolysaccharide transport system permease protein